MTSEVGTTGAPPIPPATHDLHLLPQGLVVPVAPGQTLLAAALAAGVDLPRLCRHGSCRACMARLVSGVVRHRIEWPGLLPEEIAEGWVLPCVALALGDVTLDTRTP